MRAMQDWKTKAPAGLSKLVSRAANLHAHFNSRALAEGSHAMCVGA